MSAKLLDKLNKLFIHAESAKKIGSKAEAIAASLQRSHAQRMTQKASINSAAMISIKNKPKEAEDWIRSKIDLRDEPPKDRYVDRESYYRGMEDGMGVASTGKELPGRSE